MREVPESPNRFAEFGFENGTVEFKSFFCVPVEVEVRARAAHEFHNGARPEQEQGRADTVAPIGSSPLKRDRGCADVQGMGWKTPTDHRHRIGVHLDLKLALLLLVAGSVWVLPGRLLASDTDVKTSTERAARIRVNRELTWSILENLLTLNELNVAHALLKEHLRVDVLDGRSWLLLSQTQVRLGKTEDAAESVLKGKKILKRSEPALVRYAESEVELARGNTLGAYLGFQSLKKLKGPMGEKARRALAQLNSKKKRSLASIQRIPGLVEPKNASAIPEIKKTRKPASLFSLAPALEAPPPPKIPWTWTANASLTSGYDTNILQISDDLAPQAAGLGSAFNSVGAQGVTSGGALGGMLSLSGSGAYTYNYSSTASGLNNFNAMAGAQWSTVPAPDSRFAFLLGSMVLGTFMESGGYALYSLNSSVTPTLAFRVTPTFNLDLSVSGGMNQFPGAEITTDADDRSGSQLGVTLGANTLLGGNQFGLSLGYARQFSEGANFRTIGYTSSLLWSRQLGWKKSSLTGSLGFSSVQYPENDSDRADSLYSASMGWGLPLELWSQKLNLNSNLGWQSSSSSVESANFSKFTLNLLVVYAIH